MAPSDRSFAALAAVARALFVGVAVLAPVRLRLAEGVAGEVPVAELLGLGAGAVALGLDLIGRGLGGRPGRALLVLLLGLVALSLGLRGRGAVAATGLGYAAVGVGIALAAASVGDWRRRLHPSSGGGVLVGVGYLAGAIALGAGLFAPSAPRLVNTVANAFLVFLLCTYLAVRSPRRAASVTPEVEAMRALRWGGVGQFQLYFLLSVLTFLVEPSRPWLGFVALVLAVYTFVSLLLRAHPPT